MQPRWPRVAALRWASVRCCSGGAPGDAFASSNRRAWAEMRADRDAEDVQRRLRLRHQRIRSGQQKPLDDSNFQDQRVQCREVARLTRQRRWQEAVQILANEPNPNPYLWSAVLDSCAKASQQQPAEDIFRRMPDRTVASWNSMVLLYTWLRQPDRAAQMIADMRQSSVEPDEVTYTTLITGYGFRSERGRALDIFEEVKAKQVPMSGIIYSAVMSVCARVGDKEKTWQIMAEMEAAGFQPQIGHFNSLIVSCGMSKDEERAREAMRKAREAGIEPDRIMYTALLGSVPPVEGCAERVKAIVEEMKSIGVGVDSHTYNAMLGLAARQQNYKWFDDLIHEMKVLDLPENAGTQKARDILERTRREQSPLTMAAAATAEAPPLPPPLPEGWQSAVDPSSGRTYYWRAADPAGTTTWEVPR